MTPADRFAADQRQLAELMNRAKPLLTPVEFQRAWHAAWREYADDALKAIEDPFRRWQETRRLMAEGARLRAVSPEDAFLRGRAAFDGHAQRQRDLLAARGGGDADKLFLEARLIQQQFAGDPRRQQMELGRLFQSLDGVFEKHEVKLPSAMLKGTQEAESLLSRTIAAGKPKDVGEQVKDAIDKLIAKQASKEELERLFGRAMEDAIRRGLVIKKAGG
jgi:hypothetical protein